MFSSTGVKGANRKGKPINFVFLCHPLFINSLIKRVVSATQINAKRAEKRQLLRKQISEVETALKDLKMEREGAVIRKEMSTTTPSPLNISETQKDVLAVNTLLQRGF